MRGYFVSVIWGAAILAAQGVAAQQPPANDGEPAEVVVTATRSETLASKTPMTVMAVTGGELYSAGVTNPTELDDLVPDVSIDRGISGVQITIRGVTSQDVTDKGDSSVAFMLDGIDIARATAQEVSFFDLARVEVLEGPQGTLYGRNTTGGVINVISQKPQLGQFGASLDAVYGNYDTQQGTAVVNLPVNDHVAIRAALNYDRRDNYVSAGTGWEAPLDPFKENLSGRISALFDLGRGELILRGDYSSQKGVPLSVVPAGNFYSNFDTGPPTATSTARLTPVYIGAGESASALMTLNSAFPFPPGSPPPLDRADDSWGVMADFGYDLGWMKVNYLGSHRGMVQDENGASVFGYSFAPGILPPFASPNHVGASQWQTTQELRFSSTESGPLKVQGGFYYFGETNYLDTIYHSGADLLIFVTDPDHPVKAESWAPFGQATYSITDTLRLTGGVRYTRDMKSQGGASEICLTTACTAPGDSVAPNIAKDTWSRATWRGGVDYDLNDASLLYAVYSTGYKAGGFNDGCVSGASGCPGALGVPPSVLYYKPETLTSYEAGLKTRFLGNALHLNLAAFHYNYGDLQLLHLNSSATESEVTNAAQAKVDGVELESLLNPTPSDRFELDYSRLNARYTNYPIVGTLNWSGRPLDRSPADQEMLAYTHTFRLADGANIEARIHSRLSDHYVLADYNVFDQFRVPGYVKTDLLLAYQAPNDRWYLQGFVNNIENHIAVTYIAVSGLWNAQFADPRTYGGRVGVRF